MSIAVRQRARQLRVSDRAGRKDLRRPRLGSQLLCDTIRPPLARLYQKPALVADNCNMSTQSSIEWTEVTWNPVTGCDKIATGCDNCYALALAKRLKAMGADKYQKDGNSVTSGPGFAVTTHPKALSQPLRWRSPKMVFVNSMSDLFHAKVPLSFVQEVFDVMEQTPQHTYQVLTKRAHRMCKIAHKLRWPTNLWMGVSVENSAALSRIEPLREVPAVTKFLSCEPLLGPLGQLDLYGIDWVIVGGESGPNHRPIDRSWVLEIRDSCLQQRVPFFFKQWGGRTPKQHGRTLEGRTWDEYPTQEFTVA